MTYFSHLELKYQTLHDGWLPTNFVGKKLIIFGTKQKLNNIEELPVKINGETIERVKQFKYLGVMLDENPTFGPHIDYIYRHVPGGSPALVMLKKLVSVWTT